MKRYKKYMDDIKAPDTLHQRLTELEEPKKRPAWRKYGAMAAVLVLTGGIGIWGLRQYNQTVYYQPLRPGNTRHQWAVAPDAMPENAETDAPDIALELPGDHLPGEKTIGGYEVRGEENGPETVVGYYVLPYIEYGKGESASASIADWDIPQGVFKKDIGQSDIAMLFGGQDVLSTHLDWDSYELSGWGAWYEDGSLWGAYIYGYKGPLDHFEFAVTAGHLPPACTVLSWSVEQEVRGLTVTADGYDSVDGPEGGVDGSTRRVSFMKDDYGCRFDLTGTSRALTEERVSRLVRQIAENGLELSAVGGTRTEGTYTCGLCGQTIPEGMEHSHPFVGTGGPEGGELCGYPLYNPNEAEDPPYNAPDEGEGCGMPDMDAPPALKVLCGSDSIGTLNIGYEWSRITRDGQTASVIACGAHPLDYQDAPSLTTSADQARLSLAGTPDRVQAVCWPDSERGNYSAASQSVQVRQNELTLGYELSLKQGGWIYEVTAEWDNFGRASYVFCIVKS